MDNIKKIQNIVMKRLQDGFTYNYRYVTRQVECDHSEIEEALIDLENNEFVIIKRYENPENVRGKIETVYITSKGKKDYKF